MLPRVYSLQNFVLDLDCCAVFFHHNFPFALDVKISMYGYICMGEPHAQASLASQLELDEEDRKPWKRHTSLKRGFSCFLTVAVEDADAGLFKGR